MRRYLLDFTLGERFGEVTCFERDKFKWRDLGDIAQFVVHDRVETEVLKNEWIHTSKQKLYATGY